jgi:threonine synthase
MIYPRIGPTLCLMRCWSLSVELEHDCHVQQMKSTQSHLECSKCRECFAHSSPQNLCTACAAPLLARYDLIAAKTSLSLDALRSRELNMWRYVEVLPDATAVTLGEGMTPLLHARALGARLGLEQLYIKDEGLNPTGSFKARGLSAAVTMAAALGIETIALPTAGNAGGAAAAYAAKAGVRCVIAMPTDTPAANVLEARAFGADVRLIDGLISDCGKFIAEQAAEHGWFEVSTLKEPYRIEGKKTMGYELWEAFAGELPDVVVYPTGGGVGLIGMWKAFEELEAMGLTGADRPRMISVQAEGCAPIVRAFEQHASESQFWEGAATLASGLRVPKALGDFIVLADVYASHGAAIAASDSEMMAACKDMAALEGVFAAPEGGASLVAVQKLVAAGRIAADESVIVFNTGSGYKYAEAWHAAIG